MMENSGESWGISSMEDSGGLTTWIIDGDSGSSHPLAPLVSMTSGGSSDNHFVDGLFNPNAGYPSLSPSASLSASLPTPSPAPTLAPTPVYASLPTTTTTTSSGGMPSPSLPTSSLPLFMPATPGGQNPMFTASSSISTYSPIPTFAYPPSTTTTIQGQPTYGLTPQFNLGAYVLVEPKQELIDLAPMRNNGERGVGSPLAIQQIPTQLQQQHLQLQQQLQAQQLQQQQLQQQLVQQQHFQQQLQQQLQQQKFQQQQQQQQHFQQQQIAQQQAHLQLQLQQPQPDSPPSAARAFIETTWEQTREQNQRLARIREQQKRLMQSPEKDLFEEVCKVQLELRNTLDAQIRAVERLYQTTVMTLHELTRWMGLATQLRIQSKQLDLYQKEILQLTAHKSSNPPCFAALALTDQPCSSVIFKGKHFSESYNVQLLTGANIELSLVNKVKASIVCESHLWKNKFNTKSMNEDTKMIEVQQQAVQFQPKFLVGTRKNAVNLLFSLRVRTADSDMDHSIESELSNPFVVITNECQWAEAEGTLIKKEAFGTHMEVPWAQFANVFHMHFINATRQDITRPARSLHYTELGYLQHKFFDSKPIITVKDFDLFWEWFGKGLHLLRYQRHIGNLWKSGLIYGLIDKQAVNDALMNEKAGSFLIRFSENHSGSFAVAFKHLEDIKHYLVKQDDIGAKKTLPDFLNECPQFVYVLRVSCNAEGNPVLTSYRKDAVLDPFLSQRTNQNADGYDELPKAN